MYTIPDSFAASVSRHNVGQFGAKRSYYHDRAVYSLWTHFVDYCARINAVPIPAVLHQPQIDPNVNDSRNAFIPTMPRLPVFVKLATEVYEPDKELERLLDSEPITGKHSTSVEDMLSELAYYGNLDYDVKDSPDYAGLAGDNFRLVPNVQPLPVKLQSKYGAMNSTDLRDDILVVDRPCLFQHISPIFPSVQTGEPCFAAPLTVPSVKPLPHPQASKATETGSFGLYLDYDNFFRKL
jgi:hypothetical protein